MRYIPALLLATAALAAAQENPITGFNKMAYAQLKMWIARSAEKMPDADYAFKPAPDIRSFGQLMGHIADAQYRFCSVVLGEKNPAPNVEKTKTAKADIMASLKDAFAYCDKAYAGVTDASAAETINMFGMKTAKVNALTANNLHTAEHYGNTITYLRLKGIVPPSSDAGGMQPVAKAQ